MQSKKDLYQIGEVARLFHLSISLLRHYDKTGLVTPEYTDPDTGYRYYSIRQFECLNTIRYLRAWTCHWKRSGIFFTTGIPGGSRSFCRSSWYRCIKAAGADCDGTSDKEPFKSDPGALSAHPGEIFLEKKAPLKLACMKKQLNP